MERRPGHCLSIALVFDWTPVHKHPLPVSYLTKLEAVSLAHEWSCGMCKWVALAIGQAKLLRDPARPPCTDFLLHHRDCKKRRFPFVSLGRGYSFSSCSLQTWPCAETSHWKDMYGRQLFIYFFPCRWRCPSSRTSDNQQRFDLNLDGGHIPSIKILLSWIQRHFSRISSRFNGPLLFSVELKTSDP